MRAHEGGIIRIVPAQSIKPLRVLLIDDHLMVAEVLAARLSAVQDIWVAGRCSATGANLPDIVRRLQPDVITIDVEPFGPATGKVLRALIAARPDAKVVVLSAESDIELALDAARAGAAAWVAKSQSAAELEAIIRGVYHGESWYPPEMLGGILRGLRADVTRASEDRNVLDMLSPRERDVLRKMVEGKHGRDIAQDLMISTDTVRTHIRNIFAKLDVHSSLEAVRVARAAGLNMQESLG